MKIKIYLNKTFKNSANLINFEINASYFNISKNKENKTILVIDNIEFVDNFDLLNSLEFISRGYTSIIDLKTKNNIHSSILEFTKKIRFDNFENAIDFIRFDT